MSSEGLVSRGRRVRDDASPARRPYGSGADERWRRRFGSALREQRELAHVSIFDLARRADTTADYLLEIERGDKWPSIKLLIRVADALGVTLREVLP
jgi:ribosome-binding protein aMBF1 (putative translation factor)